jgi:hypothetical protein
MNDRAALSRTRQWETADLSSLHARNLHAPENVRLFAEPTIISRLGVMRLAGISRTLAAVVSGEVRIDEDEKPLTGNRTFVRTVIGSLGSRWIISRAGPAGLIP